ncbi:hypothetical protein CEUSTIGMA_g10963.t1 [Chlamydomonas eustigma]|uniref:Mediator complex subunit Med12 domain-containing protein n=1 Tax=Chlamydomonas eustigma TaxID=1157962 RepID=A0A250XKE3_9CHLO|nr:hypothetical protein CEUSTIGMA_g10963.t1 [Chlamydomonas eustigma]|eukprot:GAX83538.1 hypothetical protein CEUSTIGMA_g10963.t1 [Chlamydomonas eustigma]
MGSLEAGLAPYRLECPNKLLSSSLGVPDFFPLRPGCPEDVLTPSTIQKGYKDSSADVGISEAQEHESMLPVLLRGVTHAPQKPNQNAQRLLKGAVEVLAGIRDRLKVQRREEGNDNQRGENGQTHTGLHSLHKCIPDIKSTSSEEAALVAWLHELASSGHSRLHELSKSVPHFANRHVLLQALWHCQVPTPRATWLIRIVYTNWAVTASQPPVAPLTQASRRGEQLTARCSTLWTQHILEGLEAQLDAQALNNTGMWSAQSTSLNDTATWPYGHHQGFPQPVLGVVGVGCAPSPSSGIAGSQEARSVVTSVMASATPTGLPIASPEISMITSPMLNWDEPPPASDNNPAVAVSLTESSRCWIEGSARSRAAYLCRLAGHSFHQGMADVSYLLDWSVKQLSGDEARAETALLLLSSCLQDVLLAQSHARRLVEALVEFVMLASSSSTTTSSSLSRNLRGAKLAGPKRLAVQLLQSAAAVAPHNLLVLDCLPQLAASCSDQALPISSSWMGTDGVDRRVISTGYQGGSCSAVDKLLKRNAMLTESVGSRILNYSDAGALQELERVRTAGDVEAGFKQLIACTGGNMSKVSAAVQLLCEYACCSPFYTPLLLQQQHMHLDEERCSDGAAAAGLDSVTLRHLLPPQAPRLLFTLTLMSRLHQEYCLWHCSQSAGSLGAQSPQVSSAGWRTRVRTADVQASRWSFQEALVEWLDGREEVFLPTCMEEIGDAGEAILKLHKLMVVRVSRLLIEMTRIGLFSPEAYLRRLLVDQTMTRPGLRNGQSQHALYLKQLHPDLLLVLKKARQQHQNGSSVKGEVKATEGFPFNSFSLKSLKNQSSLDLFPGSSTSMNTPPSLQPATPPLQDANTCQESTPSGAGVRLYRGCQLANIRRYQAARSTYLKTGTSAARSLRESALKTATVHVDSRKAQAVQEAVAAAHQEQSSEHVYLHFLLDACWEYLGVSLINNGVNRPEKKATEMPGASGTAARLKIDVLEAAKELCPWQQVVLSQELGRVIKARFAAAGLPGPALGAWHESLRIGVEEAEGRRLSSCDDSSSGAAKQPEEGKQQQVAPPAHFSGINQSSAGISNFTGAAVAEDINDALPSLRDTLPMSSVIDAPAALGVEAAVGAFEADEEFEDFLGLLLDDGLPDLSGVAEVGAEIGAPLELGAATLTGSSESGLQGPLGAAAALSLQQQQEMQGAAPHTAQPLDLHDQMTHPAEGMPSAEASSCSTGKFVVASGSLGGTGLWLQRAVSVLDACHASADAVQLLMHILEGHVSSEAALQAVHTDCSEVAASEMPRSSTGSSYLRALEVSEGALISCLEACKDRIVAMAKITQLLDLCTIWAFQHGGQLIPLSRQVKMASGREGCGRVIQFAAGLLACYQEVTAVKDWWSALKRSPAAQHGNHWILGDVSALVGSPPFNDASQHQVYPGSNVLALPPLYTTPLIRAEKLAKQLQGLGPGSACSSSSVLLAPAPGSRLDEAYSVAKSLTESSHSHMSEMQANGREVGQLLGQWCSRNAASTPGVAAVSSAMVDQERVVVSITALMLLGLQAMTERSERQLPAADTAALNIQQEQSSVSSLISVRQHYLSSLQALRQHLLRSCHWPQTDTVMQQAVISSCGSILLTLATISPPPDAPSDPVLPESANSKSPQLPSSSHLSWMASSSSPCLHLLAAVT